MSRITAGDYWTVWTVGSDMAEPGPTTNSAGRTGTYHRSMSFANAWRCFWGLRADVPCRHRWRANYA